MVNNRVENVIEITWNFKEYALAGNTQCIPYTELKEIIVSIAYEFEEVNKETDWKEFDYNEEIVTYANKELARELWRRLEDVSFNPDTEKIEEEWNGFAVGTAREDIWRWFEETFHVSVGNDLMGQ